MSESTSDLSSFSKYSSSPSSLSDRDSSFNFVDPSSLIMESTSKYSLFPAMQPDVVFDCYTQKDLDFFLCFFLFCWIGGPCGRHSQWGLA